MLKGLGNLASLLKQAHQIRERMSELQASLAAVRVEAQSGGGMVRVEANGQQRILACHIDPTLLETGDREMLEDLVVAAVNQALDKAREAGAQEMQRLAESMNLPGLGEAFGQMGFGGG